ncbi:MAG TPA: pyruvate kinase [Gammaproteobacteria bacterium]
MSSADPTIAIARHAPSLRHRTKIVATLGPATDDAETLVSLFDAGVDVVRVNFSHGSAESQAERIERVRRTASEVGRYIGIIGDLGGPKIRIESFAAGQTKLEKGATFTLDTAMDPAAGTDAAVGVAYDKLVNDVAVGDMLLLDDGQIVLNVLEISGTQVRTNVIRAGVLSNRKGLNKQGGGLTADALTDRDRRDIRTAAKLELDYIAVSFVRNAEDVNEARRLLTDAGGRGHIIAKIERAEAVENIDDIIVASDAIMVARGDLAVEVGYAAMTGMQKGLIRMARKRNKVSITATQMLESMISSAAPTRAEVSDVANAVMDGTDAVMLSAETAVGQYPVDAVRTMAQVCVGAEKHEETRSRTLFREADRFQHVDQAIAMAVMFTASHLSVKAIIALTESGSTALWMSRRRSDIPIYALTRHEGSRRRVTLYRGVYPVSFDVVKVERDEIWRVAMSLLRAKGDLAPGDLVLYTYGQQKGVAGATNTMQILTVPADDA